MAYRRINYKKWIKSFFLILLFGLTVVLLGFIIANEASYWSVATLILGVFIIFFSFRDPVYPIGLYFFHSAIRNLIPPLSSIESLIGPVLILCAIIGIVARSVQTRKRIFFSFLGLDLMILIVSFVIVLSIQFNTTTYNNLFIVSRELIGVLGIYFVMRIGINSRDQLYKLIWFYTFGFVFLAGFALVTNQVKLVSLTAISDNPYMIDALRLRSSLTIFDPNYFAWTLLMPIAISAILLFQENKWAIRFFSGFSFLVLLTAIIITMSRGMWIAFIIMMIFFVIRMPTKLRLPIIFIFLIVSWLVLTFGSNLIEIRLQDMIGRRNTAIQRFDFWRIAYSLLIKYPILGVGYGAFPFYNPTKNVVHNTFLSFFAETGFLGGLSFSSLYLLAWLGYRKAQKSFSILRDNNLFLLAKGLEFGLIGQIVGLMSLSFNLSSYLILGLALAGILVNLSANELEKKGFPINNLIEKNN